MSFKSEEQRLEEVIKNDFDYASKPENCGKVVSKHFDGIVFVILGLMVLFIAVAIGGIYFYSHSKANRRENPVRVQPQVQTQ